MKGASLIMTCLLSSSLALARSLCSFFLPSGGWSRCLVANWHRGLSSELRGAVPQARAATQAKCNPLRGNAVTSCSNMFGNGIQALLSHGLRCEFYLFVYNVIKFLSFLFFFSSCTQASHFIETKSGVVGGAPAQGRCQEFSLFSLATWLHGLIPHHS